MTSSSSSPTGAAYIKAFAASLSTRPGVYRMIDTRGTVLYVGKAKHLRHRVKSYVNTGALSSRILRMVESTASMEIIETRNEAEALLLEATLIKEYQPRYNILLKDDKSYPYIRLSAHDYPRITKHRGKQDARETYFGPFASAGAVEQVITTLQRAFLLRPCSDNVFAHRTRPCLQYQIKRCSAPCVGYVSEEEYAGLIAQATAFLKGRNREVQEQLTQEMQRLSEAMEYEKAARCRDRIRVLTQIQEQQRFAERDIGDADIIAAHCESGVACVQVWFFRGGQNYGNHTSFPANAAGMETAELMAGFIGQYYQSRPIPPQLYLAQEPSEMDTLAEALSQLSGHRVRLHVPQRGDKRALVEELARQAEGALTQHLAQRRSETAHLKNVAALFGLAQPPAHIEVYDNSHIAGTHMVGAMICAGTEGFEKDRYRRFTIRSSELAPGDDYAMMREVLTRRLTRLKREDPDRSLGMWPDLMLIDGGKGQLAVALSVAQDCGVEGLPTVAIAKGEDRNAGREQFFMAGREPFQLPVNDPTLHYLQRLRDEAHRFAITSHRVKRANAMRANPLDEIPGVGGARRKALMLHFGSARAVQTASLEALQQAPGISAALAKRVYEYFNG